MSLIVLTGDFVDSTGLPDGALEAAFAHLRSAVADVARWPGTRIAFSRRGGDGWQIAMQGPYSGLRLTLALAAALIAQDKRFNTRIALARGGEDMPDDRDLNAATTPAFVASGRLLETIGPRDPLWAHADGGALDGTFALASDLAAGWTRIQAQTLSHMIRPEPGPRVALAARLGKSRQSVDKALHAAGYPTLIRVVEGLEGHEEPRHER